MSDIVIPVMENNPLSGLSYMAVGKGKKFHLSLRNDDTLCPASRRSTAVRYVSVDEGASGELCTSCYRTAERRYEDNRRTAYAAARDFELDALSHGVDAETAAQARKTAQEELMDNTPRCCVCDEGSDAENYVCAACIAARNGCVAVRGTVDVVEMLMAGCVMVPVLSVQLDKDGMPDMGIYGATLEESGVSIGVVNKRSKTAHFILEGANAFCGKIVEYVNGVSRDAAITSGVNVCGICRTAQRVQWEHYNAARVEMLAAMTGDAENGRVMVRGTDDIPATLTTLDGPVEDLTEAEYADTHAAYKADPTVASMIAGYDAHVASVEKAKETELIVMVKNDEGNVYMSHAIPNGDMSRALVLLREAMNMPLTIQAWITKEIAYPRIFLCENSEEAYDISQCCERVRHGDILIGAEEKAVAILDRAWPVAITESHGEFHGGNPADILSAGSVSALSVEVAQMVADAMADDATDAGFSEVMVTLDYLLAVVVDENTGATVELGWVMLDMNAAQQDDHAAIAREYGRLHGQGTPRNGWESLIIVRDIATV